MALMLPGDAVLEKLDLQPGDVLIIKSADVGYGVIQSVKERFEGKVVVLGIGPDENIYKLRITPEDTLVISSDEEPQLDEAERDHVIKNLKKKIGCKGVLFLGPGVTASVPPRTLVGQLVDKLSAGDSASAPENWWCSPLNPCNPSKCMRDGKLYCACSCHPKEGWHCDNCGYPTPPPVATEGAWHTNSCGVICGNIVKD